MASPTEVVQAQVDANNRRDAEGFSGCYAEEAVVITGDGQVMMSGREAIMGAYRQVFEQSPDLHADILARMEVGSWVIDEERATGLVAEGFPPDLHAVVAYQIQDGLIVRAQMFA